MRGAVSGHGLPLDHDVGPLVKSIMIFHVVVEGTPPVNLLQRDLLRQDLFHVGFRHREFPLHGLFPVDGG